MSDIDKKKPTVSELRRREASVTKFVTDPEEEKCLEENIIPKLYKSK